MRLGASTTLRNQRAAAGDFDGLGAVVRFIAAGPPGGSGLSAAEIFGARKFVAAVVDHVMAGESGRDEGLQLGDLHLHGDRGKDQKRLQRHRREP